ncbi:hypothetical protein D3C72_2171030 [compost metagenome]
MVVKAAQMQVAFHQLVLIQVAQYPFQQAAGGGKQRLGRSAQLCTELGEHLVAGTGVVITVDDPFRFTDHPGAFKAKLKTGQTIACR